MVGFWVFNWWFWLGRGFYFWDFKLVIFWFLRDFEVQKEDILFYVLEDGEVGGGERLVGNYLFFFEIWWF